MAKKHKDKNNTQNADTPKAPAIPEAPETLGTPDKPKATEPANGNPPPAASSQQAKPEKKKPKEKKEPKEKKKFNVVDAWEKYFGVEGGLKDWQRLCDDLGLHGDLRSKKKCKKAMAHVWINIHDFLRAREKWKVKRFPTEAALAEYTIRTHKVFPRDEIRGDSPLKLLLARILYPGHRGKKGKKIPGAVKATTA